MDPVQESVTFPSIVKDKMVLLDMLLAKLQSVVNIARALNMHSHLRKLVFFIGHSEYVNYYPHQVTKMLKLALYRDEHVIEKYEIFTLRKQLLFPSRLNRFACRVGLCLKIRKLVKKLDKIEECRGVALCPSASAPRERALAHTQTSVRCPDVLGRDTDRDIVVEMLLTSGNEASLFVIPIVGVGGIGKTTLAKLVYNDPRIKLICEALYENNYLIVLDDVWNEDPMKWDELKKSLVVGACGSKILVTTRNEAVAFVMGTVPPYCLKGLLSEDCLTLFLKNAFKQGYEVLYPNLVGIVSDLLWIAEGLINKSNESEDLEHIAIHYFQELLSRSFFQDVEEYRPIYTSICTMHDLVHDLALSAAGVEFCAVNSHMQNISGEVRRVVFSDYDLSGKELPASVVSNRALRTISFSVDGVGPMSSIIKELPDSINKLSLQTLRVSRCPHLEWLPKDIGNLISLRHLHITTNQASFPDKAIGCLPSLRSLYICSCENLVSLSEDLLHLTSLRTLAIIGCPRLTFFPSAMKHLTALENLLIVDCEELTLLEWQDIEGLRMLQSLVIGGLPELESKDVQCLENLQMLVLAGLPQLVCPDGWKVLVLLYNI
ncbi:disease resistance protein RGA2-like [Capsicum galapagoense]